MKRSVFALLLRRGAGILIPIGILLAALLVRAWDPPALRRLRLETFDSFQRLKPRDYQPVPVRIIDVDEESLRRVGQWPWPRTQVAELVHRLQEAGAAAIAFDIIFAESDRTSPDAVIARWPASPSLDPIKEAVRALPDHDAVLAETIGSGRVITGFTFIDEETECAPARPAGFAYGGDDPLQFAKSFRGAVVNLEALEAAAAGNGHVNPVIDHDGIIRRVPLILRYQDRLYPSLAAEALRVAQGAASYKVKSSGASGELSFGQQTGITSLQIGRLMVPTDGHGNSWVYYTDSVPERTVPAWQVFEGAADPEVLAGHVVFIGTSAAGLKDLRTTPLNPAGAGVEIHAQIAEQVLTQTFLIRPDWATGAEVVFVLLLGLGLLLLLPRVGALWCALISAAAIAAISGLSWIAFIKARWLIDPVFSSIVALGIYLTSSLISFLRTEAERRQVRTAFGRYLAPAMVERLADHPEQLVLGGEQRTMTLLFADIRGFTTMAEQFTPQELTRFMNTFLTPMTRVILANHGTIDKYMGDCIMAFWNAPLDDPQHARHACEAALAMREALVVRNAQLREAAQAMGRKPVQIDIGIGINTGECCVGNMGSEQRFDYSVLGDNVNLAARLEGQSKLYGTGIVITEATRPNVEDLAILELDLIRVKGKTKPVRIFAVLGDAAMRQAETFGELQLCHEGLLKAYRGQRWEEARKLLAACRRLAEGRYGLGALYELYEQRIAAYAAQSPGRDWDGVFIATTK